MIKGAVCVDRGVVVLSDAFRSGAPFWTGLDGMPFQTQPVPPLSDTVLHDQDCDLGKLGRLNVGTAKAEPACCTIGLVLNSGHHA